MDKTLFGITLLIGIAIGFLGTQIGNDIAEEQQRIAEIQAHKDRIKENRVEQAIMMAYNNKRTIAALDTLVLAIFRKMEEKDSNGSVALEE